MTDWRNPHWTIEAEMKAAETDIALLVHTFREWKHRDYWSPTQPVPPPPCNVAPLHVARCVAGDRVEAHIYLLVRTFCGQRH